MPNLNKVMLIGHLTREPELRHTRNDKAVCSHGLAVNRSYTTQSGEKQQETCFVDVTWWGRRAEVIDEYLSKGDPIFIEGRLKLDQWETDQGEQRSKLEVVGDSFEFLSSGDSGGQAQRGQQAQHGDVSDDEIPF